MEPMTPPMTPDRLLASLNPDQRQAVESKAPHLVVIAGAGSGKTRTLAAKIVRLVRLEGAEPESVLAFTFTRAAASELRGRIQDALGLDAERVEITTLHGWAWSLLQLTGHGAGLQVAEEAEVEEEIDRLYEGVTRRPEANRVGVRALHAALREIETTGLTPDRTTIEGRGAVTAAELGAFDLARVLHQRLRLHGLISYGQILPLLEDHLNTHAADRTPQGQDAGEAWERFRSYRHVLVDEAQDLTELEQRLIRRLGEHAARCYVLDPRQAIYGWRGSIPLEPAEDAHVVPLRQGYRFGDPLASASEAAAANTWSGGWEWLERHARQLRAAQHETKLLEVRFSEEEREDVEDLRADPLELLLRHVPPARYGGQAVLTRTNRVADLIVARDPGRFHRVRNQVEPHLRAVMAMARLALNHRNAAACAHLLRVHGWPEAAVEEIRGNAGRRRPMSEQVRRHVESGKAQAPLLLTMLPDEKVARSLPLGALVPAVCSVRQEWKASRDDLLERLDRIGAHDAPLPRALDILADELRVDGAGWDYAERHELVGVGTIHGAKGREWDHVALVTHAEDGTSRDPEEWRTHYVALTRARRSLLVLELPRTWRAW